MVMKRGLVPSLSYNDKHIITESAIVVQFLADINPTSSSHALLPPSGTEHGALYRARAAFFVDTFVSKVLPFYHAGQRSSSTEERDKATEGLVGAVVKEVEPLLQQQAELEGQGQGPFFGGSEKLTLVEVRLTTPPPPGRLLEPISNQLCCVCVCVCVVGVNRVIPPPNPLLFQTQARPPLTISQYTVGRKSTAFQTLGGGNCQSSQCYFHLG